jgi:hypothetical protein
VCWFKTIIINKNKNDFMSEPTNFTNQEILNSTLLSSMAYLEDRMIRHGDILQKRAFSKLELATFLKENGISKETIITVDDFEKQVDKCLRKVMSNPAYKAILAQKTEFYKSFQEEFRINENSSNTYINKIARKDAIWETKKIVTENLIKELKLFDIQFIDYRNRLEEKIIKSVASGNEEKRKMYRDVKTLWEKFSPIEFSQDLEKKYKLYDPKNDSNIKATFHNGYIDAGSGGKKYKDASLLMGYVKNKDDDVLYISFRGTEQKVKSAFKYFLENYPNMERQYNYFEPIIKDVLQEEIKKYKELNPNKKLKVVFTGHSLGAALAEKSLDKFQDDENVSYKGIFVSNPGSFHYVQNMVNKLDKIECDLDKIKNSDVKNFKTKFLAVGATAMKKAIKFVKIAVLGTVGLTSYVVGAVDLKIKKMSIKDLDKAALFADMFALSTLAVAKNLNSTFRFAFSGASWVIKKGALCVIDKKNADSRACTINHEQDNIPHIGKALFQNHNPQSIILNSALPIEENKNLLAKIFQIDYHGREIYYTELKKKSLQGDLFKPLGSIGEKTPIVDKIMKLRENLAPNKAKEKANGQKI